jgi:hypothetical protein
MTDVSAQPAVTPARRRRPRGNPQSGGQKAYASENDAGVVDRTRHQGTPQTPHKMDMASPETTHSFNSQTNPKQKNKPRNKPKAGNASPESARARRQTPPLQRSTSAKSGPAAAFAGATFHASPAPSALPIPSFLARASNESPSTRGTVNFAQEPSPPATDTELPTPQRAASVPKAHESPLEFMFRAHRQEKDRQQRGSPFDSRPDSMDPASPSVRSPFAAASPPSTQGFSDRRHLSARQFNNAFDPAELDGTPSRSMGPAFSTPYHERIKAAQNTPGRPTHGTPPRQMGTDSPAEDPTAALKKFLFSGNGQSNPSTPSRVMAANSPAASPHYEPSTRPGNIQAMENDLRRILKLDQSTQRPSASSSYHS